MENLKKQQDTLDKNYRSCSDNKNKVFVARDVIFNDIEDDKVRMHFDRPKIIEVNQIESPTMQHFEVEPQHEEPMDMADEDLLDLAISNLENDPKFKRTKAVKR